MKTFIFYLSILSFLCVNGVFISKANAQINDLTAENLQLNERELCVMVDGKKLKISESARKALIINKGKDVIFTSDDGAGGFENEGQSLWIYNVRQKQKQKILSAFFMIDALAEKKLSNGKTAILVKMSDGGLGASYFSVVDPTRGEVFFRGQAELLKIYGDKITLGFYQFDDEMVRQEYFDKLIPNRTNVKPIRKETHDLKKLLTNEVIYNEQSITKYLPENKGKKRVKIYLWRANDVVPNRNFVLSPGYRYVNPKAPLSPTLEALFGKLIKDETDYGFSNPTFGLKFQGVILKNGTATIKISQSPNNRNYGTLGAFIFVDAVKKTAMQFPTVKKVEICRIGETFIDAELAKPFSKCK